MGLVRSGSAVRWYMASELTDFQKSLRLAVDQLFVDKGRQIVWSIRGVGECFYYGESASWRGPNLVVRGRG